MFRKFFLILAFIFAVSALDAKLPDLTPKDVTTTENEIMKQHALYHKLSPMLVKRSLLNYLEELDPNKTYFIEPEIHQWLEPSDALVNQILQDYNGK